MKPPGQYIFLHTSHKHTKHHHAPNADRNLVGGHPHAQIHCPADNKPVALWICQILEVIPPKGTHAAYV